jgi:hypothetical protein
MPRLTHGLTRVFLCGSILILTAVFPALVRAQNGPSWTVKGVNVSSKLAPQLKASGGSLSLLSKVSGTATAVSCSGTELTNLKLEIAGLVGREGTIRFTGCQIKLGGTVSAECEPLFGSEKGVFVTNSVTGELVSGESVRRLRFRPVIGETLATISTIGSCAIGKSIAVLGNLTLADESLKTESSTHTFSQSPLTALWLVSKTEEHKTTIDGSLQLSLGGEHSGLVWNYKEVVASWNVKGTPVSTKLLPALSVTEVEGGSESILSEVLKQKFEKLCTGMELIGAKLEPEGKITSGAKVKFTGCIIKLNGKISPPCEPHTGAEKGVIVTKPAKGLLYLDGEEGALFIEPVSGETLVTVELGEECSIGEQIPLFGRLVLNIPKYGTEATTHLLTGSSISELWLISNTAEHKVTLDGSGVVALSGEHKGLEWSGQ